MHGRGAGRSSRLWRLHSSLNYCPTDASLRSSTHYHGAEIRLHAAAQLCLIMVITALLIVFTLSTEV